MDNKNVLLAQQAEFKEKYKELIISLNNDIVRKNTHISIMEKQIDKAISDGNIDVLEKLKIELSKLNWTLLCPLCLKAQAITSPWAYKFVE